MKAPDKPDSGTDLTLTAEWKKMSAIPGNPVGGGSGGGSSSQSYYYIYADCAAAAREPLGLHPGERGRAR